MSLHTLSDNALASLISTVIGALLMFKLYWVLIRELGIEQIGVWALLVSSSSLIRLAECGMSGGATRFVARNLGAGEPQQALAHVILAVVFLFTSVGLAALLSLAPIRWILTATVHNQVLLEDVLMLLPHMLTLWLGAYSEIFVWNGLICLSGWFVNMLAVPSFMLYVAAGKFRWLIATQITIGGLSIVFGLLGGTLFGGLGVATGAMLALALALGTLVVVMQFQHEYHVSITNVLPRCWKLLFGVSLAAVVFFAARALHWHGAGAIPMSLFFIYLGTAAALFVIVGCVPVRANLTARMFQREMPDYQGAKRKAI